MFRSLPVRFQGLKKIEAKMKFATHPKYGFLTFCPSNLGTTMRASVHVRVPKLSANKAKFNEVCEKYNLQVGAHSLSS